MLESIYIFLTFGYTLRLNQLKKTKKTYTFKPAPDVWTKFFKEITNYNFLAQVLMCRTPYSSACNQTY